MATFSEKSFERLNSCDARLVAVFDIVVQHFDCSVLEGHRSPERQAQLLRDGKSKVRVSKHNAGPSMAVDVAPYPIEWPDDIGDYDNYLKAVARFYALGGFVKAVGVSLGINIRWGGDWDGDWDFKDQSFDDLVHFELID